MGIIHDNYLPLQGIKLNPTAIVDQKPWLSIQLVGLSAYGRNNLIYLPNSTLLSSPYNSETNLSRLNYSGYVDIEIDGAGASLAIGKYAVAINSGIKGYASIKKIPGEIANAIANEEDATFADGTYNTNNSRMKAMAWGQVGVTFGGIFFQKGNHMITGAATINRLYGLTNANLIIKNANVTVDNSGNSTLNNLDGKFGYTDFSLSAGRGWSTSMGVTYKKMKEDVFNYTPHTTFSNCRTPNYLYKLGFSILDLGYINYTNNAFAGKFNETMNGEEVANTFEGNTNNDVFEDQKNKFTSVLPTAFSVHADYNLNDKIYFNFTAIQKVFYPSFYGTERDNLASISARYESKWFGIGVPFVLQNYRHPQIGLALRFGPLSIGTDHLTAFLFKSNIYSADVYASLRINLMKSPKCRENKVKNTKNKRSKLIHCPAWN